MAVGKRSCVRWGMCAALRNNIIAAVRARASIRLTNTVPVLACSGVGGSPPQAVRPVAPPPGSAASVKRLLMSEHPRLSQAIARGGGVGGKPAPIAEQARAIVTLAGGMDHLLAYTRHVAKMDVALACHLADGAFYANPNDPAAQALVIEVYLQRTLDPRNNTQEILAYLDMMAAARQAQMAHQP
jgi:hypothetical protein